MTASRIFPTIAITVALATSAGAALAGCSNDTATYREATEDFLEDDPDGDVVAQYDTTFTDVECEEPDSTEVGTTYVCTGVDADGASWTFDVEIDGEDSFSVDQGTKQD